jgi:hypothetical protein
LDGVVLEARRRELKSDGGRALEQDVVPQFHDGIALRERRAQLVSIFYGCRFAAAGAHVELVAVR